MGHLRRVIAERGRRRMEADGNKGENPVGPAPSAPPLTRVPLYTEGAPRIVHSNGPPMVQGRSRMAVKCAQTPGKRFVARREIVCPFACIRGSIRVSQSRWSWFAGLPSSKATRSFFLPLL